MTQCDYCGQETLAGHLQTWQMGFRKDEGEIRRFCPACVNHLRHYIDWRKEGD